MYRSVVTTYRAAMKTIPETKQQEIIKKMNEKVLETTLYQLKCAFHFEHNSRPREELESIKPDLEEFIRYLEFENFLLTTVATKDLRAIFEKLDWFLKIFNEKYHEDVGIAMRDDGDFYHDDPEKDLWTELTSTREVQMKEEFERIFRPYFDFYIMVLNPLSAPIATVENIAEEHYIYVRHTVMEESRMIIDPNAVEETDYEDDDDQTLDGF